MATIPPSPEEGWSIVSDNTSSQWSLVSSEKSDDWSLASSSSSSSHTAIAPERLPRLASPDHTPIVDEEKETVLLLDDKDHCIRRRVAGKRALKHSFVRRPHRSLKHERDNIEVTLRGTTDNGQSYFTSPLDELVPDLVTAPYGRVTLDRDKRFQKVLELVHKLESEGLAHWENGRQDDKHGRGSAYHDNIQKTIRLVVKPTGMYTPKIGGGRLERKVRNDGVDGIVFRRDATNTYKPWYELTTDPPTNMTTRGRRRQEGSVQPLKGRLKGFPPMAKDSTSNSNRRLDSRAAFTPGVAKICGYARVATSLWSSRLAVAKGQVDLVFHKKAVPVTHVAIAGQIHNTREEDDPILSASSRSKPQRRQISVAYDGSDAYCTRVALSARLAACSRKWVLLGTFSTSCKNGYEERSISLANSVFASRDGSVLCHALRFKALSWHNAPMLRVGAYGLVLDGDDLPPSTNMDKKAVPRNDVACNGGEDIIYTFRLSSPQQLDNDEEDSREDVRRTLLHRRMYTLKKGKTFRWMKDDRSARMRKREVRSRLQDEL